jgi:hypothetical protein
MKYFLLTAILSLPSITFAQATPPPPASSGLAGADPTGGGIGTFVKGIIGFINEVLFPLALAIAFIALVWGIVKYFVIGGDSDDGKSKGKDLIIYSVVGFVIILSFYGIINVLANGLGFSNKPLENIPTVPKVIP